MIKQKNKISLSQVFFYSLFITLSLGRHNPSPSGYGLSTTELSTVAHTPLYVVTVLLILLTEGSLGLQNIRITLSTYVFAFKTVLIAKQFPHKHINYQCE